MYVFWLANTKYLIFSLVRDHYQIFFLILNKFKQIPPEIIRKDMIIWSKQGTTGGYLFGNPVTICTFFLPKTEIWCTFVGVEN